MGHRLPQPNTPEEWHAYVRAARTFVIAQDRMEEAVRAGVDFAALNALAAREPDRLEPRHG
jgi:hypothetical protein